MTDSHPRDEFGSLRPLPGSLAPEAESVPFQLQRIAVVMEPEPSNPFEQEGVLNPAAARGRDGQLYLFPRLVAQNNSSRIGIARVGFDAAGNPARVERLGIVLEPAHEYDSRACEDPRITHVLGLGCYAMTYTALSERGPRIALAVSHDLFEWERVGLLHFHANNGVASADVPNKDALLFPEALPDRWGVPRLGLIHRPLFPASEPGLLADESAPRTVAVALESLWLSYASGLSTDRRSLVCYTEHHRLVSPASPWERLKVGGGTPPVRINGGWLLIYHGVSGRPATADSDRMFRYSAGALVLDSHDPTLVRYRSPRPILVPEIPEEVKGTVDHAVFPTGIDQRLDIGLPHSFDVYYGMADRRIGVARLEVPDELPPDAVQDPHLGTPDEEVFI